MEDLQNMPSGMLVENFRALCRGIGSTTSTADNKRLSDKADLYEQEILRRMAW